MVDFDPAAKTDHLAVERIHLPDGGWWDIRTYLTRGMEKAVTRASLAAIPAILPNGKKDMTAQGITDQLLSNMNVVDTGRIEDAYLLHGTVGYSYGLTIDLNIIDALDSGIVRQVLNRMFELYNAQKLSEEERKDFFEKPAPAI
jgi:hypothetical protein